MSFFPPQPLSLGWRNILRLYRRRRSRFNANQMALNLLKSILHNIGVVIVGLGFAYLGTRADLLLGIRRFHSFLTAPCSDVAPPVIDSVWGCLIRRPPEKDRGHRQAHLGLSKATWGNIIATRYQKVAGSSPAERAPETPPPILTWPYPRPSKGYNALRGGVYRRRER
jgi:hypothetical protein